MNCLIKQQHPTSGYHSIPHDSAANDETAAVPFGTTTLATTTTTMTVWGRYSPKWIMVASVLGMIMMLVVAGGGTVLRQDGEIAAAEGLVVATAVADPKGSDGYMAPCVPAGGTFGGVSTTSSDESYAFETCFQFGNHHTYCWTKSYLYDDDDGFGDRGPLHGPSFAPCAPKGDAWQAINADYVITPGVDPKANPKRCGTPCQGQQHEN